MKPDSHRILIAKLADGQFLAANGTPHVWGGPGSAEIAYRCTTCGGSFYAKRTFQARDGLYYCVEHILSEIERAPCVFRDLGRSAHHRGVHQEGRS